MAKNDAIIQNQSAIIQSQAASLRTLENQVGQLANALSNRPQGSLPSDTENPRKDNKEHCKAITLRNGIHIEQPTRQVVKEAEPSSIQNQIVNRKCSRSKCYSKAGCYSKAKCYSRA
ncbi:hypothetical protein TIFTF001_014330 [Ficus carica]|uniref:Uncharacterized protein n=1 Tax=Ficus carica TaxID=3494 RepID=A0AA88A2J6_FICCA|nr:hypothetical protein TIFTF001_014330 [Ficus carica]